MIRVRPQHALVGFVGALSIHWMATQMWPATSGQGPAQGYAQIAQLIIAVALSALAGYLLKEDRKNPLQDEHPAALASRGAYCAWVSGVRRVGYVVVWVGQRSFKGSGGSFFDSLFGGGASGDEAYEAAVHVIAVGPVNALHRITYAGETIFDQTVRPSSHPSGTLHLSDRGFFKLYWGEPDQPKFTSTTIGTKTVDLAEEIGVDSAWPYFCYIVWLDFRVGVTPVWSIMSYDIEKRPSGDWLDNTISWVGSDYTLLTNNGLAVLDVDNSEGAITASVRINPPTNNDWAALYEYFGQYLEISGARARVRETAGVDGPNDVDIEVTGITPVPLYSPKTAAFSQPVFEIFTDDDISALVGFEQVLPYRQESAGGANPAHSIADMLFESWPSGAGLDPDEWDLDSLEDLGVLAEAEQLQTTWVAQDGAPVAERLGAGLQDLGCMVPVDTLTGKIKFVPLREPFGTLSRIDDKHIVDTLPELEKRLGPKPIDFIMFGFPDAKNNYRDMTIGRMEDGQIGRLDVARASQVAITISTDYNTSATIADRRTQEEMSQGVVWSLETNRSTRHFYPGQAILASFTTEVLRVLEVAPKEDSGVTQLKITVDNYGIAASTFSDEQPPRPLPPAPLEPDFQQDVVEHHHYGTAPSAMSFVPMWLRSSTDTQREIYISSDDITFTLLGYGGVVQAGGLLKTALSSDGLFCPEDGTVLVSPSSLDINDVPDFSASSAELHTLVTLVSPAGVEFCTIRKVTAISLTSYSLDGLRRARYDTVRLDHPADDTVVYIGYNIQVTSELLVPETTRYFKIRHRNELLSAVDSIEVDFYGKGVRPPPVTAVSVSSPRLVNAYATGEDVTLTWNWSVPGVLGTSAGWLLSGTASGTTDPEGEFLIEIRNMADTLVASYNTIIASFDYTNANIVADLGSQVSFKVSVYQLRDGYTSSAATATVEKI